MPATIILKKCAMSAVCLAATALAGPAAEAYAVNITAGTRAIYLQVGNGTFTGTYSGGGTPGNNATINRVSVTVAANAVGSGVAQQMTSNSTAANSPYDNFAFCTTPAQVYIGGFFRLPGAVGTATLTVTTSAANLTNASGDTIPFSQISWASGGAGDAAPFTIPAGTFTGGTQTLTTFPVNTWRESCHRFSYANAAVVASGTYTGRATYTLSAP